MSPAALTRRTISKPMTPRSAERTARTVSTAVPLIDMVGVPNAIAVEVGGKVERFVLSGAFILISFAASAALVGNAFLRKFHIEL